ncbi:hypothetical protein LNP74_09460 [Klebsiella pneumoniae subsp. pneumoniae]|nr:hypothetical protein [Klebsiella pneumoniae subsp. pneumoniae]
MLNYRNGINKGLYKIMSKMGDLDHRPYRCSKLFRSGRSHRDVSELCFQGVVSLASAAPASTTSSRICRICRNAPGWRAAARAVLRNMCTAANIMPTTRTWCAPCSRAVQSGEYSDYQQYAKLVNERPAATLRDLLALNPGEDAISIDEVEPAKGAV